MRLQSLLASWIFLTFSASAFAQGPPLWEQKESVNDVNFSPDGKSLITASGTPTSGFIALWDIGSLRQSARIDGVGMPASIAVAPDGRSLVVLAVEGSGLASRSAVEVWDVDKKKRRFRLDSNFGQRFTYALAVSGDSKMMALGRGDAGITLHDLATGKQIASLAKGDASATSLAFAPNHETLAAGHAGAVRLWNIAKQQEIAVVPLPRGTAGALAFFPDGKTLAIGIADRHDEPGEVLLWDIAAGKEKGRLKGHAGPVISVQISRDGKLLASGARSSDVIVWDAISHKKLLEIDGPLNLTRLALSGDGKALAVAGGTGDPFISFGGVRLWDLPSGRERLHPKAAVERERREKAMALTAAAQAQARARRDIFLVQATAERARRAEYALKIYQARDHADRWQFVQARSLLDELRPAKGESDLRGIEWHLLQARLPRMVTLSDGVHSAAISPDGSRLALGVKKQLLLCDASTGKTLFTFDGFRHLASNMVFSGDSSRLAAVDYTANADQSDVRVFRVDTGKEIATLKNHRDGVNSLAFSHDGKLLASGARGYRIIVWETATWKATHVFDKQKWIVDAVAFSPDGKSLASGTVFHSLQVRDLASGKELFTPGKDHEGSGDRGLLFLPDGKHLLAAGERNLSLFETTAWRRVRVLADEAQRYGTKPVLTPDGRNLILNWTLLDLASGKTLAVFEQGSTNGSVPRREDALLAVGLTPSERVQMVTANREGVRLLSFPLKQKPIRIRSGADQLSQIAFSANSSELIASTYTDIATEKPGVTIITGSHYHIERWDARAGSPRFLVRKKEDKNDIVLKFDANGSVVSAGRAKLTLADLAAVQQHVTLAKTKEVVQVQALSPDRSVVAFYHWSRDAKAYTSLHDARTGAELARLPDDEDLEGPMLFTADSRGILTWHGDLVLWDAKTGVERKRWELPGYCQAISLTADGQGPAMALFHSKRRGERPFLWNFELGERVASIHTEAYLEGAAFSADGQVLATIVRGGTIRLFDARTGHPRGVLTGNPAGLQRLAFRPDGRALAVGEFDGAIRLWTSD